MSASAPLVTVLAGGDSLQRQAEIKKIAKRAYNDDDYEIMRFDAAQKQTIRAVEELLSFSMLDPNRVVVLENADTVKRRVGAAAADDDDGPVGNDLAALLDFIKSPRGEAPLVLLVESEKDLSAVIKKALPPKTVVKLAKTSTNKIREAVLKRCKQAGVEINPDAVKFFLDQCGDDAAAAQRELEKLLLWAEDGQTITLDDCRRLIETEDEESVWELTAAAGQKKTRDALMRLHQLLEQGDHPIKIMAALSNHFRMLYSCRALMADGVDRNQWAKRLGKPPWMIDRAGRQAGQFSLDAMQNAVRLLQQADADGKGGKSNEFLVVERLVIDLCRLA
ncbi:MAG: DNA polymerase III subunit delta [Candidatus Hinthialibacter antarcticus]|nr:DNA polymerase III subunit delta [Candidatus Hinthialibacter antarcticus]